MMTERHFVICAENRGYEASLERRKLYEMLVDPEAETHDQIRVIDESGEDYLYPKSFFIGLTLPRQVVDRLLDAA